MQLWASKLLHNSHVLQSVVKVRHNGLSRTIFCRSIPEFWNAASTTVAHTTYKEFNSTAKVGRILNIKNATLSLLADGLWPSSSVEA